MKPYAVAVIMGEKKSAKEFDTEFEMNSFLKKAEELKAKAPSLLVKIIRKPQPKQKKEVIDDPREDSLCWISIHQSGKRVRDGFGKLMYKCVPAPFKGKNLFYCPYCLGYKEWKTVDLGYGNKEKGCETCGITKNDFNVKSANNLWKWGGK
jgi:hypothetical protein